MNLLFPSLVLFTFCTAQTFGFRTWVCQDQKCVKEETKLKADAISMAECKAKCLDNLGLWPKPNGKFVYQSRMSTVDVSSITFTMNEYPSNVAPLLSAAKKNFLARVRREGEEVDKLAVSWRVVVKLEIYDPSIDYFTTETSESYVIDIKPPKPGSDEVEVSVQAQNFFGLRHGLETLSQLFFYDDLNKVHKLMDSVYIEDKPAFTHRGITLDTARSYISVDNILKILDMMAMNKLNTFHWHITDSQSFPYVSLAYPQLSESGAYSERQVYTQSDVKRIVQRARELGIRVVPEFDAPAHVGEGWSALGPDLVTCYKWEPWNEFCAEPPCGQLDPSNNRVYEILGAIYNEYVDLFQSDLFHMGGDEVNMNCWANTPNVRRFLKAKNYTVGIEGYYQLWGHFHEKTLKKLREIKTDPHPQPILWTSTLTQPDLLGKYLHPEDFIIQIWTNKSDPTIKALVEKKFKIIFSNYDELYFDCGGPSWVGPEGHNWCSPYIGWQYVYNHSPYEIILNQTVEVTDKVKKLVLGSEVAVWTEQIDDSNVQLRLWPRAAALGERLWSDPAHSWVQARFRMNHHRERMSRDVQTELLQPQWCYQNDGSCDSMI